MLGHFPCASRVSFTGTDPRASRESDLRKDARQVRRVTDMMKEIAGTRHGIEEIQFYFLGKNAREMTKGILARYADLSAAYTDQYVEIFSKQASKGTALCALAQELGIERSEIACIGDGENDLTMFRAAGMKMAMGNAVEEIKTGGRYRASV